MPLTLEQHERKLRDPALCGRDGIRCIAPLPITFFCTSG